ncbi:MAG: PHP domain-containing protein [Eubacterium sp.]|nr:PHP domain-containing protein [Eubacterium sp.]
MNTDSIKTIDLHMHTTVSDGTDTPEEILDKVRKTGLDCFSVTDHDAILASRRILKIIRPDDPAFITGVEFSCKDSLGKYHILGYGYDPEASPIQAVVARGHQLRMGKMHARVDFLREHFHMTFSEDSLNQLFALDNPGKPHLGNLMVEYGYAETKEDAIDHYINLLKTENAYVDPKEAIKGILESGGIPVLAHPSFGSGSQRIRGQEMELRLKHLMDYGLKGLEAYYSGFDEGIIRELLDFADRYDLYVTAGSDYHGRNKKISLGQTNLACVEEGLEGLERFLADVISGD